MWTAPLLEERATWTSRVKSRSLRGVNEHFKVNFHAVRSSAIVNQRFPSALP